MANLDRFVFNSDYPMDKIVYFSYGSTTIPAKSGYNHSAWPAVYAAAACGMRHERGLLRY